MTTRNQADQPNDDRRGGAPELDQPSNDVWEITELDRRKFLFGAAAVAGAAASGLGFGTTGAWAAHLRRAKTPPIMLKLSMAALADSPEGRAAIWTAKRISHLTDNQVGMLVYPNFTLAPTDPAQIQQVVLGAIDIACISSWTGFITQGVAFDLPYAFSTVGGIRSAFSGPPGQTVKSFGPALGVQLLDWWVLTWRNLYGSKTIYNPGDLSGLKVRTQGTKAVNSFYQACGASPQTIASSQIYLALQTGQVDLVESSFQFCYQQNHFQVAHKGTADHHGISTYAISISNQTWNNKLNAAQRKAVQQAFTESGPRHDKDSIAYVQTLPGILKKDGMTINSPLLTPFQQIAKGTYSQLVTTTDQQNVLSQLQAMGFAKS